MKNGLNRFIFYTQQIETLLEKAAQQKDPALWLFNNDARKPFFMLEGLARLYAHMHNPKRFKKLKGHFKLIEDGLGQIDHYHSLSVAFASNKNIPEESVKYIKTQFERSLTNLNKVLIKEKWLSKDNARILKINKKLENADWLKSDKETEAISLIYNSAVADISHFAFDTNFHFDNVEEDVHELRRKLRWLSIYPQALQGVVQYSSDTKSPAHLKKYLTKEIIDSPFNKFPPVDPGSSILYINKNYFLALSWMIDRLGKLKDEGLLIAGVSEALMENSVHKENKLAEAELLLGKKQRKMQAILKEAASDTKTFFEENNLQYLISKTK